jgi:hypothetical protein
MDSFRRKRVAPRTQNVPHGGGFGRWREDVLRRIIKSNGSVRSWNHTSAVLISEKSRSDGHVPELESINRGRFENSGGWRAKRTLRSRR